MRASVNVEEIRSDARFLPERVQHFGDKAARGTHFLKFRRGAQLNHGSRLALAPRRLRNTAPLTGRVRLLRIDVPYREGMRPRSLLYRLLLPAVLLIPAFIFAGWLIRGALGGELLAVLLVSPACLVAVGAISALIWARPDARSARAVTVRDAITVGVIWLLWTLGAFLPNPAGGWLLGLALLASIIAIVLLSRELKRVAARRLDEMTDTLRERGANPTWGQPREPENWHARYEERHGHPAGVKEPGAGIVIEGAVSSSPRPGNMPGSTRVDGGVAGERDTDRPGANFGANRAPKAENWDPRRPVPGTREHTNEARDTDDSGDFHNSEVEPPHPDR